MDGCTRQTPASSSEHCASGLGVDHHPEDGVDQGDRLSAGLGGARYASKLFNPEFLRSQNLPTPAWLEKSVRIDPGFVNPS